MRSPFSPAGRHTGFFAGVALLSDHSSRDLTRERRSSNLGKPPNKLMQRTALRAAADRQTLGSHSQGARS